MKPIFNMDERNKQIASNVIIVMYLLTIIAIYGIIFYRQFGLGQEINEFEDFAIVGTINSVFLISALLYFGAIPIQKLKIKTILLIYSAFVILGSLFTYAKYNLFQSPGLTVGQLFDKLFIIVSITGLMMGFWILLTVLGKKKIDKEL